MSIDLKKIPFVASPNYSKGRKGKIEFLVIHALSGFYESGITWFKNPKSQVSAHYVISKKGEITQCVKDSDTAWHAKGLNSVSLGLEHADAKFGDIDPKTGKRKILNCISDPGWITPEMWDASAELSAHLCKTYNIPVKNIIGHNDPVLRRLGNDHADPGKHWNMDLYRKKVQEKLDKLNKGTPNA